MKSKLKSNQHVVIIKVKNEKVEENQYLCLNLFLTICFFPSMLLF